MSSTNDREFEVPPFYCPRPKAVTPLMEAAQRHALEWLDSVGLSRDPALLIKTTDVRPHQIMGFAASLAHDEEAFRAAICFVAWIFLADDTFFDSREAARNDPLEAAWQIVDAFEAPDAAGRVKEHPLITAARDAGRRLRASSTPAQYGRLVHAVRSWCMAALRMAAARRRAAPPSEDHYLAMRVDDSAYAAAWLLIEMCGREPVPDNEYHAPASLAAFKSAGLSLVLDNDLYSYRRELDEPHQLNIVTVIRDNRRIPLDQAVSEAVRVRDRVMLLFERLRTGIATTASAPLRDLLDQIAHISRGHVEWGLSAPRYGHDTAGHWATAPSTTDPGPLPFPSLSWWWQVTPGGH